MGHFGQIIQANRVVMVKSTNYTDTKGHNVHIDKNHIKTVFGHFMRNYLPCIRRCFQSRKVID
jgi:hypothetical protein